MRSSVISKERWERDNYRKYELRMREFHKTIDAVCREPYRLFFPLGIGMGMVGMSPWFFYAFGLSATYSGFFHSSVQMMVYMNCFVAGFLMTFIPRFTGTFYATRSETGSFLLLFMGMAIFLRLGNWMAAQLLYLVWHLLLIAFVVRRVPQRQESGAAGPPVELVWIPAAIAHAIIGTSLLLLSEAGVLPARFIRISKPMFEQGFITAVVLGIGAFLVARMMGVSKKPAMPDSCCGGRCAGKRASLSTGQELKFQILLALGLFLSFWLEGFNQTQAAYGLRALIATIVFLRARVLLSFPQTGGLYIRLAWIAVWMVVAGLWLAALFPQYKADLLHICFIGGFSLMTFGVGTMVVMSHAGESDQLKSPLWILWIIALSMGFVLLNRLLAIHSPGVYFRFLGLSSAAWMAGGLAWLIFIVPKLLRVPAEDEFGKMHDQAKERLTR